MRHHYERVKGTLGDLKGKLVYVFISLLLLILSYPFLNSSLTGSIILSVLVVLVPLTGIYAVSYDRRHLGVALLLGTPYAIINIIDAFAEHPVLPVADAIVAVLFFGYTIIILLEYLLAEHRVTRDTIYGAISVYLMLGVTWGALYNLVENLSQRAFSVTMSWGDTLYYSFSTLTTLGFGDITPVSAYARTLSVLEAVTGVLYVAIIIATLVGNARRERM